MVVKQECVGSLAGSTSGVSMQEVQLGTHLWLGGQDPERD